MNLSLRLNLLFALALALLLASAASVILKQARESIDEETDSALTLTLQLMEALSSPGPETDLSGQLASDDQVMAMLINRVARLRDVRHLDIGLVRSDGLLPFAPDPTQARTGVAPLWFARLVAPDPVEYRYQLALQGRRVTIALRPNPADEIDEAWNESRSTFTLLLVFAMLIMLLTWFTSRRALQPVGHVLRALDQLREGDYTARLQRFDLPELRRISEHFNHVASTLAHQSQENRELSRKALAIQEAERRHLAQELHDELGQSISAIKALAVSIRQRSDEYPSLGERAGTICEVSDQMYSVVRRLMSELRPATLDDLGLVASLHKLIDDWRDRHRDVDCELTVSPGLESVDQDVAIKLYRIVQEGLTNVARHARAQHVTVHLDAQRTPGSIELTLSDDGVGVDDATRRRGLGLLGIRERVSSLGGEFSLRRRVGASGTELRVAVPAAVDLDEALTDPAYPVVAPG